MECSHEYLEPVDMELLKKRQLKSYISIRPFSEDRIHDYVISGGKPKAKHDCEGEEPTFSGQNVDTSQFSFVPHSPERNIYSW